METTEGIAAIALVAFFVIIILITFWKKKQTSSQSQSQQTSSNQSSSNQPPSAPTTEVPDTSPDTETVLKTVTLNLAVNELLRPGATRAGLVSLANALKNSARFAAQVGAKMKVFITSVSATETIASRIGSLSMDTLASSGTRAIGSMISAGRTVAEEAPRVAARIGTAAAESLVSVGGVFDAIAITGLVLDETNTGNLDKPVYTNSWEQIRVQKENDEVNSFNDDKMTYPLIRGPMDSLDANTRQLAVNTEFFNIIANPPNSGPVFSAVSNLVSALNTMAGTTGQLNTADIIYIGEHGGVNGVLAEYDVKTLHNEAISRSCTMTYNGAVYKDVTGNNVCSFADSGTCLNATTRTFPGSTTDTNDTIYTEWRPKAWFDRLNGAVAPAQGACIGVDPTFYQACISHTHTTLGESSGDNYDRTTGICQNVPRTCEIYGSNFYRSQVNAPSWAGIGPLDTCGLSTFEEVLDDLLGTTLGSLVVGGVMEAASDSITLENNGYTASLLGGAVQVSAGGISIPGLTGPGGGW